MMDFVRKCLHCDSKKRLSVAKAWEHEWIKSSLSPEDQELERMRRKLAAVGLREADTRSSGSASFVGGGASVKSSLQGSGGEK